MFSATFFGYSALGQEAAAQVLVRGMVWVDRGGTDHTSVTRSPTRIVPLRTTVAYTPALFSLRRTTVFMTRGSWSPVSGSKLTIMQRRSRIVTLTAGPGSLSPNTNVRPTHQK